ncbi:sulfurtransferase complex subunit TusC [Gilvimarinus xylanilyticus]|uniref:Sulfurtransferase complex subunit TusC n=1 Tax=Gilvimarinus xylanilyticus TaxID=2944139 RepID=A0A9X2I0U3_9GAMM|nr:sulfurtransferase complex subunit TusC [Gilvimarinus xylanilyticus]MCP8898568.1 sulfurtransferase complex subunit TusC [Gilvimarinus xylanilyticus]
MRDILCISRHSPQSGLLAKEALDTVLAGATFDQSISLLLMDEGVWQACAPLGTELSAFKDLSKNLNVLALYGVDTIYIHANSLKARGLNAHELSSGNTTLLDQADTQALMRDHQHIFSF